MKGRLISKQLCLATRGSTRHASQRFVKIMSIETPFPMPKTHPNSLGPKRNITGRRMETEKSMHTGNIENEYPRTEKKKC